MVKHWSFHDISRAVDHVFTRGFGTSLMHPANATQNSALLLMTALVGWPEALNMTRRSGALQHMWGCSKGWLEDVNEEGGNTACLKFCLFFSHKQGGGILHPYMQHVQCTHVYCFFTRNKAAFNVMCNNVVDGTCAWPGLNTVYGSNGLYQENIYSFGVWTRLAHNSLEVSYLANQTNMLQTITLGSTIALECTALAVLMCLC